MVLDHFTFCQKFVNTRPSWRPEHLVASFAAALAGVLFLAPIRSAASDVSASLTLDRGYRHLLNLDFAGAEQEFNAWQQQHPANPMGPASQAAGLLFAEFHRLGVLETQFYESDEAFDARKIQPVCSQAF